MEQFIDRGLSQQVEKKIHANGIWNALDFDTLEDHPEAHFAEVVST